MKVPLALTGSRRREELLALVWRVISEKLRFVKTF